MKFGTASAVKFVRRTVISNLLVVTDIVSSVIGKPEFTRPRMPVKPHGVSHSVRENLKT